MLAGGGLQQKVLALRKEPEIDVMQAVPVQQVVCENIHRAVNSIMARTPVRPACFAGTGSGAGTGIPSPAIKRPCGGEFPGGKEGHSPHKDSRCRGGNLRNGSNAGVEKNSKEMESQINLEKV